MANNNVNLEYSSSYTPNENWSVGETQRALDIFRTIPRDKLIGLAKENKIKFYGHEIEDADSKEIIQILFSDTPKEKLLAQLNKL